MTLDTMVKVFSLTSLDLISIASLASMNTLVPQNQRPNQTKPSPAADSGAFVSHRDIPLASLSLLSCSCCLLFLQHTFIRDRQTPHLSSLLLSLMKIVRSFLSLLLSCPVQFSLSSSFSVLFIFTFTTSLPPPLLPSRVVCSSLV
jgi:hypothetical protein